jgi:hypothetical protein
LLTKGSNFHFGLNENNEIYFSVGDEDAINIWKYGNWNVPEGFSLKTAWRHEYVFPENENKVSGSDFAFGDFNNDGYDDLVVGNSGCRQQETYLVGQGYSGEISVYHGNSDRIKPIPDQIIIKGVDSCFGISLESSDINNDGYDDLIVGSSGENKIYLYLGSSTGLSEIASWSTTESGDFGADLDFGDINNDGYDDLIVGAPDADKVYVYINSGGNFGSYSRTFSGASNSKFGFSVALGDINNDGYDDLAIGAPRYYSSYYRGKVDIYLGTSSGISTSVYWSKLGDRRAGDQIDDIAYGYDVLFEDFNNDGYDDLVVGQIRESFSAYGGESEQKGKVLLYYSGGSGFYDTDIIYYYYMHTSQDRFGWALSSGDLNRDGYPELMVGCPSFTIGEDRPTYEGAARIYTSNETGILFDGGERWDII